MGVRSFASTFGTPIWVMPRVISPSYLRNESEMGLVKPLE